MNLICSECGQSMNTEKGSHRYRESGLPNVVLQGVDINTCSKCGNREVSIPHLDKVHRAIALGIARSPRRLGGPQYRFLRKYLGQSLEQMATFLSLDKASIARIEKDEEPISAQTDGLMRLLVAALDAELNSASTLVAQHLPNIVDEYDAEQELHVDVTALTASYLHRRVAA